MEDDDRIKSVRDDLPPAFQPIYAGSFRCNMHTRTIACMHACCHHALARRQAGLLLLHCSQLHDLSTWPAAPPYRYFNPVQSATFNAAFHTNANMVVAAPTGAGKTGNKPASAV